MKFNQDQLAFKPITIVLEKQSEAEALFDLADRNDLPELTEAQKKLLVNLSNARSSCEVNF